MLEDYIRQTPLFHGLPDPEIRYLAETLRQTSYPAGTVLIQEADPAHRFFILLQGEIEIIKALGTPDERQLAIRQAGSFIGEMGLLSEDGQHTASVLARTDLALLEMTRAEFNELLHRQPTLAYEMVRTLSRRLHETENLTIRDLRQKNLELTQAYRDLEAAQAQLIEKERLERELELARGIQSSILPRALPAHDGYDFGALMEPMRAVGGDFYDFIALDDHRLGVAVGDVSDHGVPAALFMALAVTLLRAEARRTASPMEAVSRVNEQLLDMNDTGMFVTLLYGVLDLDKGTFQYVRAGHEPPVVVNRAGVLAAVPRGAGQLVGVLAPIHLELMSVTLAPGDTMVLFTDGVTEANSPEGAFFGGQRLRAAIQARAATPAQSLCCEIYELAAQHRGPEPSQDDTTLVAVKIQ